MERQKPYDGIILGTGIAALGCAIPLARAGKKVLMIGKKGLRGESTQAAAGILDPLLEMKPGSPLLKLSFDAFAQYPRFVKKLERETGRKISYAKTGMLYVAQSKKEEKSLVERYRWQDKMGFPVLRLSRAQILKSQPDMAPHILSGLYYPTIAKVNPQKLRIALLKLAKKLGVQFQTSFQNASLVIEKNQITAVRFGIRKYAAPIVVNATGAWAGEHSFFKMPIPVVPARGQILILKGKLNISTIAHSLDGAYIVPWESGQYLIGSTVEFAGFNPHVTGKGIRGIEKRAGAIVPSIKRLKRVTAWAGLRPFPKDRMPLIGPTSLKGYYLATGYYRSGILIGAYAGRLLAQGILSGKMPSSLYPFRPQRFEKDGVRRIESKR